MEKNVRKFLATMLSFVMVFTSFNYSQTTAKAEGDMSLEAMVSSENHNLALGCRVTSGYKVFNAGEANLENLTNGNLTAPRVYPKEQKEGWYQIDLGKYYTFDSIDQVVSVYNEAADTTWPSKDNGYYIQYSTDGAKFVDAKHVTGVTLPDSEPYTDIQDMSKVNIEGIKAVRYIRVFYPDSYIYGVQLRQLAVLNVEGDAKEYDAPEVEAPTNVTATSDEFYKITVNFDTVDGMKYQVLIDDKIVSDDAKSGDTYVTTKGIHTVKIVAVNFDGFPSEPVVVENVEVNGEVTNEELAADVKINLALNKTYIFDPMNGTAPGSYEGNGNIVDGDATKDSGYSTTKQGQDNVGVIIDLGDVYNSDAIDKVAVWFRDDRDGLSPIEGGYDVQYSYTGESAETATDFETVGKITSAELKTLPAVEDDTVWETVVTMDTEKAVNTIAGVRFVKINFPKSMAWGAQIREVALLDTDENAKEVEVKTIDNPAGITAVSNRKNTITVTVEGAEEHPEFLYNIYVDGAPVLTSVEAGEYTIKGIAGGIHKVSARSVYENSFSPSISAEPVEVEDASVEAPKKLEVNNYGQYTGKYFVVFTPVKGISSYNIYVDNKLIKNVNGSGYYLTSKDLKGFSNGEHTLGVTSVDAEEFESKVVTVKFTVYEKGKADDIPQIYISTQGRGISGDYFKKKDGNVDVNVAVIDNSGKNKDIIDAGSDIKVRGNSTAGAQKKPYNIKFSSKTKVLGMEKAKKWCLLANAFDKSLIRNSVAMHMAHEIGLDYTGDSTFVDVYCNGTYLGNYLLIEAVETGKGRVEIDAEDTTNTDMLLELDGGRDGDEAYHLAGHEISLMLNEPEILPDETEKIALYQDKIDKANKLITDFETALNANDYEAMEQCVDMESFAKFYIVNEFMSNQDFDFSSTRFYIKDGKIYGGPCWDYDLSSGNLGSKYGTSEGMNSVSMFKARNLIWYIKLMQNETFSKYVAEMYEQYLPMIRNLYTTYIDELVDTYGNSFARNFASVDDLGAGWSVKEPDQADQYSYATNRVWNTYEEAIAYLKTWLKERNTWLENQFGIDDPLQDASIVNKDGQVTVRWNDTTGTAVDHYKISYSKFESFDSETYKVESTEAYTLANADVASVAITDAIAGNTEVKVEAVDAEGNATTVGKTIAKGDLKITEIYLQEPQVVEGQIATFCLKVTNVGTGVACPVNDVITSILKVDGIQVNYTAAYNKALKPNQTEEDYTFPMTWVATAGTHTIQAQIDERNKVDESNEGNNTTTIQITIDSATTHVE